MQMKVAGAICPYCGSLGLQKRISAGVRHWQQKFRVVYNKCINKKFLYVQKRTRPENTIICVTNSADMPAKAQEHYWKPWPKSEKTSANLRLSANKERVIEKLVAKLRIGDIVHLPGVSLMKTLPNTTAKRRLPLSFTVKGFGIPAVEAMTRRAADINFRRGLAGSSRRRGDNCSACRRIGADRGDNLFAEQSERKKKIRQGWFGTRQQCFQLVEGR